MTIEAEPLNELILRRLLPQTVLDVFPQIMWQKLSLFLEEKHKGSANLLGQRTSQKVNKNLNQDVYCGGIVYHYLHPNQQSTMTQKKLSVKITANSKRNQKY
jgi:hypothetical protein